MRQVSASLYLCINLMKAVAARVAVFHVIELHVCAFADKDLCHLSGEVILSALSFIGLQHLYLSAGLSNDKKTAVLH